MAQPIFIFSEPTMASYGTVGALYQATFQAMGIRSLLAPYPSSRVPRVPRGSIVLHSTFGFRFDPIPGARNIAVPFHEWSRYPARWAKRLNRFEQVWAASDFLRNVLRTSGVSTPVGFVPPALDLDPPRSKRSWSAHRPFRFLFVGEPHFRKGHHLLIEGFRRLTSGNRAATLTIKTSPNCAWKVDDANIRLIAEEWPLDRLWHLYESQDGFVSASLGEGLGLGVAEAMLARLPVATNRWGGHASLVVPDGYVRIPHRVVPQPFCSQPDFFAPGQQCALSSPEAIASAMQQMMTMSARAREQQAECARSHVAKRFGFAPASARLRAALAAH
jgi:glycosyltransferase involved in cell wall biosynthesis